MAVVVACSGGLTGCIHARDFGAPAERITDQSAYAEHKRVRVEAGLIGRNVETLGAEAALGVTAVRDHLDFRINFAHGAFGIVNAQSKFNILDTRWYGLGGRLGFLYVNPRTFWFLPSDLRKELGVINIASVPFEIWNSFPFVKWFHANIGLQYRYAAVWGNYTGDDIAASAQVASRSFSVLPYFNFYAGQRVALIVGARVPLFSQAVSEVDGETEVSPGVVAGVRSVEWTPAGYNRNARYELAGETRFSKNTHMRLSVVIGAFQPVEQLFVMPALSFYWRFK
jgi:hypothetical protein